MKTTQLVKILTIASSSLAALMGGLATLPVPSDNLPIPPQWRPYLVSVAFIAGAIRIVIIPFLDSIIKGLKENPLPLLLLGFILLLPSCNLTVNPDGSKNATLDAKAISNIAKIISEK